MQHAADAQNFEKIVFQSSKKHLNRFPHLLALLLILGFALTSTESAVVHSASLQQSANPFSPTPSWESNYPAVAEAVAWGDVDNDGDLDLAVSSKQPGVNELPAPLTLYINQSGTLAKTPSWFSQAAILAHNLAWGDMNNDGWLDLAVGSSGSPSAVFTNQNGILRNIPSWTGAIDGRVAWGDIDNDNDLDLVIGGSPAFQVYQNVNSTLQSTPYWQPLDIGGAGYPVWGDINGDGRLDLAKGTGSSQPIRIYFNTGTTLETNASWIAANGMSGYVAFADANIDNKLDLVVLGNNPGNDPPILSYQTVSVFHNRGSGIDTRPSRTFSIGSLTSEFAFGHIDPDGIVDLYVDLSNSEGRIFKNITFDAISGFPAGNDVNDVEFADIDNDGDIDLLRATSRAELPLKLYLNGGKLFQRSETTEIPNSDGISQQSELGDVNGDGYIDLVVVSGNQPVQLFLNVRGTLQTTATWSGSQIEPVTDLALADINGDAKLDLTVVGAAKTVRVYLNQNGNFQTTPTWTSPTSGKNHKVAWGDINGDGYPELAVGDNPGLIRLYANNAGSLSTSVFWSYSKSDYVHQLVWADVDDDGDLDLLVGSQKLQSTQNGVMVFRNNSGLLEANPIFVYSDSNSDPYLAAGDMDGDGDLDIAASDGSTTRVLPNSSGTYGLPPAWNAMVSPGEDLTWNDVDNDGDIDLLAISAHDNNTHVYRNWNGNLISSTLAIATNCYSEASIGDLDGDGTKDVVCGWPGSNIRVWHNQLSLDSVYAQPVAVSIRPTNMADIYGSQVIRQGILPITYDLFHPAGKPVRNIRVYYSLSGSFPADRSQWKVAKAAPGTQLTNLSTSAFPTRTAQSQHVFNWDIAGSGIVGQYNDVVFRIEVPTNPTDFSASHQRAYMAAQSYPMRLRGSQIRTMNGATPAFGTTVFRLPQDQVREAQPITNTLGGNYLTDSQGYLQGRNTFAIGDRLFALLPISSTDAYSMYYSSATPILTGLQPYTVTAAGVHTLSVTSSNKLLLFNLIVSLEWDARSDPDFMAQLENDIRRTSQLLFDLSNGQVALGDVAIYHDKGNWGLADIIITASNNQRPSAIVGGVVTTATNDVVSSTLTITNAYVPGQVRMGATWNRFGNPNGTLGEDWPRVLAHELSHYLFFLSDNYIGVTPDKKAIKLVDCKGGAMTDPYEDSYSEWLGRSNWTGDCLSTVAEQYLGRADWQTVKKFYPMLNDAANNNGPNQLPLAVTRVTVYAPPTPNNTLSAPFFSLIDSNNATIVIPDGRGQAYLLKRQNNSDPTDDYLIALGTPVGDLVEARGAAPGDRICVFDYSQSALRIGCLDPIGTVASPIQMQTVSNWQPGVQVSGISSSTVAVTVTGVSDANLSVQLLPALGVASNQVTMVKSGGTFTQVVRAADGAYYGFVRIFVPNSNPSKELIVEFNAFEEWGSKVRFWATPTDAWGGKVRFWAAPAYSWGGKVRFWAAPTMSSDGQVSVFSLNNPYANTARVTLQTVAFPPSLPTWLTPVGQAYQLASNAPITSSAILFSYLSRDVPDGYENTLRIYYQALGQSNWQPLPTQLDSYRNAASAPLPGAGIYLLVATLEVSPRLSQGWNLLGYPLQVSQTVTSALASIQGSYSIICGYSPILTQPWQCYDPTVPVSFSASVNTLNWLESGRGYWLHATQAITIFFDVTPSGVNGQPPLAMPSAPAPAIYYGFAQSNAGFAMMEGMSIRAEVNGVLCGGTTVEPIAGQLGYVLLVPATTNESSATCGTPGTVIDIHIGNSEQAISVIWENSKANRLDIEGLQPSNTKVIYLPVVAR